MKILQGLQSLWLRRKWYILSASLALFAAIVFVAWLKSRERAIVCAIVDHHNLAGQKVKVRNLSFRPVSENYTDSLLRETERLKYNKYKEEFSFYSDLSVRALSMLPSASTSALPDSMAKMVRELHAKDSTIKERYWDSMRISLSFDSAIGDRIKSRAPNMTYIRCDYSVDVLGAEKHTDTLFAVMDSGLHIVWPK